VSKTRIVIVGAGVAGLACALQLQARRLPFLLVEASDGVGGRVRTDLVEGFRLDRGFQIVLSAYPELHAQFDLRSLDLRCFRSGALIRKPDGGFWQWNDPFREPWSLLRVLLSPVAGLLDKLRTARLGYRALRLDGRVFAEREAETTLLFLQRQGFSAGYIERFFRPFFGGVFLEDQLATSSNLFLFLFRNFLLGRVCLPALGMETVPGQLLSRLAPGHLRLHSRVLGLDGTRLQLDGGETLEASEVVLATDAAACARLLGKSEPASHSTHCSYWAAPASPLPTPMLALNPDRSSPIQNMCVPSDVADSYAPPGQSLISVSSSGEPSNEEVLAALRSWFGSQVDGWRHLRNYSIREALPLFEPRDRPLGSKLAEHLYVCGDHTAYPSLNGALASGRKLGLDLAYR
jgi:phytoene dehydrogenase-like protein